MLFKCSLFTISLFLFEQNFLDLWYWMVHQLLYHGAGHVLHDVAVHHSGDDGDGDDLASLLDDGPDLFVFNAHHVLPVHLEEVVIDLEVSDWSRL